MMEQDRQDASCNYGGDSGSFAGMCMPGPNDWCLWYNTDEATTPCQDWMYGYGCYEYDGVCMQDECSGESGAMSDQATCEGRPSYLAGTSCVYDLDSMLCYTV